MVAKADHKYTLETTCLQGVVGERPQSLAAASDPAHAQQAAEQQ